MPTRHFRVFATADIGEAAFNRLRERGYELEIHPQPEPPPKSLILEKVRSGIDGLITTLRDPEIEDRCRLYPHFASAARITRLSVDPSRGMAGRCVQGLIDMLEQNYGGDVTRMPYVVNKEAFR